MPHYTALAAMHRVTQTRYVSSPRLDVSDSVAHNVQAIDTSSSRQGYETRHAALRGAGRHALSDAAEVCASPALMFRTMSLTIYRPLNSTCSPVEAMR